MTATNSSTYAWIITRDHLWPMEGLDIPSRVGTCGPSGATPEQARTKGRAWRVRDDDGEVYYSGRIWAAERGSEDDFGPLDDFGGPDAGAVEIQYREAGKWVTL